ncbi:MAG: sulfate adenylyltransferase [Candidatus Bathyarchaeota archaeon]|nr:MAG: sulfate adenylyltransferase [Candidatus Bathyarchaeota archaeon]
MPNPHGGKLVNRVLKGQERIAAIENAEDLEKIEVTDAIASDIENLAKGVFSPLEGFMNSEELESVLHLMRLPSDLAWTIPILINAPKSKTAQLSNGDKLALYFKGELLAQMHLEEAYDFDNDELAKHTFGTLDSTHPGVAMVKKLEGIFLGGKVDLINEPKETFDQYKLEPLETRVLFEEKGWKTVVGFQTRNPPHLGHEYVQKTALAFVDGVFINPVIGKKKRGDFKDNVILEAYNALMKSYYLKESVVMSILPFEMRYAGPREAIFHAIVRKNFGCTHFIIGRDHAGVGNFYGPYDAQKIFSDFPDLGISPLFFKSFFFCKRCNAVTNEKACPHNEREHVNFSGTKIRKMLSEGEVPPKELMRPEVAEVIFSHPNPFV